MTRCLALLATSLFACGDSDDPTVVVIDQIQPSSGPNTGTVAVQLTGTFVIETPANLVVTLDDTPLDDVVIVSDTLITATVPAGLQVGAYDVVVAVDGHSSSLTGGYIVLAPAR